MPPRRRSPAPRRRRARARWSPRRRHPRSGRPGRRRRACGRCRAGRGSGRRPPPPPRHRRSRRRPPDRSGPRATRGSGRPAGESARGRGVRARGPKDRWSHGTGSGCVPPPRPSLRLGRRDRVREARRPGTGRSPLPPATGAAPPRTGLGRRPRPRGCARAPPRHSRRRWPAAPPGRTRRAASRPSSTDHTPSACGRTSPVQSAASARFRALASQALRSAPMGRGRISRAMAPRPEERVVHGPQRPRRTLVGDRHDRRPGPPRPRRTRP